MNCDISYQMSRDECCRISGQLKKQNQFYQCIIVIPEQMVDEVTLFTDI